ncbi:MAG: CdaR family protein [Treponema sp.]|nr:CdaR family protein [Treponema sp.]
MNKEKILAKLIEKWPVKVLSLAAALIISVSYRMNTLETRFFTVPLQIESSETLIPASPFPGAVRVSLRGEGDGIQPILDEDIEAFIDLSRYTTEGSYRVPVQLRKKGSAIGIEPLEISVQPIEILMLLEQRVTKNIPVFPVFSGIVAEGYELTYQSLIPGSVSAEGPRSVLESNIELNTETINLDRRYDDFSIMVNIVNENTLITLLGNKTLEFRGSISRIAREEQQVIIEIEENEIEEIEIMESEQ